MNLEKLLIVSSLYCCHGLMIRISDTCNTIADPANANRHIKISPVIGEKGLHSGKHLVIRQQLGLLLTVDQTDIDVLPGFHDITSHPISQQIG